MRVLYELVVVLNDEHGTERRHDFLPELVLDAIIELIPNQVKIADEDGDLELVGVYVKHAHVEGMEL